MSKFVALCPLLFTACATGGAGAGAMRTDRETVSHAAPRLNMTVAAADPARAFPAVTEPSLPSADRMARRIRNELGGVASADVRLCVAPDGRVSDVKLIRGSSDGDFDDAVVHDVANWQFSGSRGERLKNCERATITYRLPR
jgi:TonB family protein